MHGQEFCGHDHFAVAGFVAKPWPQRLLKWHLDTSKYVGTLNVADVVMAYHDAWASLAAIVDVEPVEVSSASQAVIRAEFGKIDGPLNILAYSHLADGTMTPKLQTFDFQERWAIAERAPMGYLDALRVMEHENMHMLGCDHAPRGSNQLIAPTYDDNIRHANSKDAAMLLAIGYGRAVPTPPPAPPPSTPPVAGKPFVISGWTGNVQTLALSFRGLTKVEIDPGDLPPRSPITAGDEPALLTFGG